jgi:predicted O-methyltransferase YrrM
MPPAHAPTDPGHAINAATLDFLLSAAGQAAAAELVATEDTAADTALLAQIEKLRRRFTPAQAGALAALVRLRRRARAKFADADRLFFTAEALEQATAETVADHRAAHLDRHAPPGPILDLGCGIGGDLMALARLRPVIAVELDPLRLRLAQANLAAQGLADRVTWLLGDWTELDLPPAAAAFADPARRQGEQRLFHLDQLLPPIAALLDLQTRVPALGVKVMPGVAADELPAACGVEFISHEGTCKEAILWFGPLRAAARWASVHTRRGWHTLVTPNDPVPTGPLAAGMTLHEPDPAVIRAGAFAPLCAALNAHLFDPQIAYLVSPRAAAHPLAQSFHLLEVHPFQLKLLQSRLSALGIGAVELKKRGAPFAPESLRGRLKLVPGGRPGVVIFTRQGDARLMLIAVRPDHTGE